MAEIQQIDPLDLRSSTGVGINLPFTGRAVFNTTYTTQEAIKANLVNFFLTNKGERYFNPSFGSDIRLLLFQNIDQDTVEGVKIRIQKEISDYFPRIIPTKFEITGDPDSNTLRIYLKYKILNSNNDDELLINIEQ